MFDMKNDDHLNDRNRNGRSGRPYNIQRSVFPGLPNLKVSNMGSLFTVGNIPPVRAPSNYKVIKSFLRKE